MGSIWQIRPSVPIRNGITVVQPLPGQIALSSGNNNQGVDGFILSDASRQQNFTNILGLEAKLEGRFLGESYDKYIPSSPADVAYGTNNSDTVLNYAAAGPGLEHALAGVEWGYWGTPSGNGCTFRIEDGSGNVVFTTPVTAAGAGFHKFIPAKRFTPNTALRIVLSAGGLGVSGQVCAEHMVI